jgi:hypothetical protein
MLRDERQPTAHRSAATDHTPRATLHANTVVAPTREETLLSPAPEVRCCALTIHTGQRSIA